MDLIKILRSLEEFLYEVLSWLIFYPRTILLTIFRPGRMADTVHEQLELEPERRFVDTVSPVLTLILTVVIAHGLELAIPSAIPEDAPTSGLMKMLYADEERLLALKSFTFGLYALAAAIVMLRQAKVPINRDTLREPFLTQALVVAPFALGISVFQLLARKLGPSPDATAGLWALGIALVSMLWYPWAIHRTYRARLRIGWLRSAALAGGVFLLSTILVTGMLYLLKGQ